MKIESWPDLNAKDIPYYVQIYDVIYQLIQDGTLKTGDSLPGENILALRWNVSRATVRNAIRKLEEDGFIYKMQGKRTTIASTNSFKKGLQKISHPCLDYCIKEISEIKIKTRFQQSGKYIAKILNHENQHFIAAIFDLEYYIQNQLVATSICFFHSQELENRNISIQNEAQIKEFVLHQIYQEAKRSQLCFNAVANDENFNVPVIIMDEKLFDEQNHILAFNKYHMHANWYRFMIERKQ